MKTIASEFEADTDYKTRLSFGSSGKLFAQIANGAPFGVLLSADQKIPLALEKKGLTIKNSRFTYALGQLALWSANSTYKNNLTDLLISGNYNTLAIANPKLAPYGIAALEVLDYLNIKQSSIPRLVRGENITQTFQFTHSGNADLGFIAVSQIENPNIAISGSLWIVPKSHYSPIKQDAVLLKKGENNPAAISFIAYLKSDKAKKIITSYGYQLMHKTLH